MLSSAAVLSVCARSLGAKRVERTFNEPAAVDLTRSDLEGDGVALRAVSIA